MKCLSCGNEIPNTSTSCPFCGKEVKPLSENSVPTYSVPEQDFNENPLVTQQAISMPAAPEMPAETMPTTPGSPILPQDQGLQGAPVAPAVPVGSEVAPPPATDVAIPPIPGSEVQAPVAQDLGTNPPVVSASAGVINNNAQAMPGGVIPPVDGARESSSAIVAQDKKKAKNKKIIKVVLVVFILLILAAGGAFGYAYYTQTQTSSKRINSIIDQAIKFDNNMNDALKIGSGKYNVTGELSIGKSGFSTAISGKYMYDLEKKLVDYTVNIENLDFDGTNLMDKSALNIELYYADSNIYVLLQNFYEKYIYTGVTGVDEILENYIKKQVNNFTIVTGIKNALKAALNAAGKKQTVKDIQIGDTKTKANVISIVLNKANQKIMTENFLRNLANNSALLDEIAKTSDDITSEKLKESLEEAIKKIEIDDVKDPATIEIYTAMFKDEFFGIRIMGSGEYKNDKIEIYPVTDGIKFVYSEDKNEIINFTYSHTTNRTKDEIEEKYGFEAVFVIFDEVVKVKFTETNVKDVNPKVERVNTKESIKIENLTPEEMEAIYNKILEFGNLGLLLKDFVGQFESIIKQNINPDYGSLDDMYNDLSDDPMSTI